MLYPRIGSLPLGCLHVPPIYEIQMSNFKVIVRTEKDFPLGEPLPESTCTNVPKPLPEKDFPKSIYIQTPNLRV